MLNIKAVKYYLHSIVVLVQFFGCQLVFIVPSLILRHKTRVCVCDRKVWINSLMDLWTIKEVMIDDVYQTKRFIQSTELATVIDVGASIGDFSLLVSKLARKVIAYECDTDRIILIRENIKVNQLTNIELLGKARAVSDVVSQFGTVDFLKIDCEGCEYDFFDTDDPTVYHNIRVISMEIHELNIKMQQKKKALINLFKKVGYMLEISPNPVHRNISYLVAYWK